MSVLMVSRLEAFTCTSKDSPYPNREMGSLLSIHSLGFTHCLLAWQHSALKKRARIKRKKPDYTSYVLVIQTEPLERDLISERKLSIPVPVRCLPI